MSNIQQLDFGMHINAWPIERRSSRVPGKIPAKLLVNSAEGNYVCRGVGSDCSQHGMKIQICYPFLTLGQTVEVVLTGEPRLRLMCRVAWKGQPGSEYAGQAGLEFLTPLSPEQWNSAQSRL